MSEQRQKSLSAVLPASLEYDGEKAEGPVSGNWDFDKKGRFSVETTDGKKVAMLRMWRKDGLEHLIEMMKQKKLFKGSLDVVPVDYTLNSPLSLCLVFVLNNVNVLIFFLTCIYIISVIISIFTSES